MKRLLTLMVTALLLLTARGADPVLTLQGSGTQSDPWIISTKEHLKELADACSNAPKGADAGHFVGKYFKQTADIDMSGITDFYGIGTAPKTSASGTAYYFGGHYDGGNFRIKNLVVDALVYKANGQVESTGANKTRQYNGLFGTIKGGSVRNVIIDKSCKFLFYGNGGGIVGRIEATASDGAGIYNCTNEADIIAYNNNIGGIAGYVNRTASQPDVTLENCLNKGNVLSQGQYIGGIASNVSLCKISNCANLGNVTGYLFDGKTTVSALNQKYYGGITGQMKGAVIADVYNAGTVRNTSDYAGGICGMTQLSGTSGSVGNAVNIGSVFTGPTASAGMIAGQNGSGTKLTNPLTGFTNIYYDSQLSAAMGNAVGNGIDTGITGMATAAITAANLPAGLGDLWQCDAGKYPLLKIAGADAEPARAAYFSMAPGKNTAAFSGDATLSTALPDMKFSLTGSGIFSIANGKLSMAQSSAITIDTVTATYRDFVRKIPVINFPEKPFAGEGTEASPYLISGKDDIMSLAMLVNNFSKSHFKGVYFKQTADIDMANDTAFIGIGVAPAVTNIANATRYFSGNYNGDGHSIKNMKINAVVFDGTGKAMNTSNGSYSYVGLFGVLDTTAVVRNVHLDESCVINGGERIGGIAGYMMTGAHVDNCSFAGKIYAYRGYGAGIVGETISPKDGTYPSVISNCVFTGEVHSNYQYAGGIVAYNMAHVENCVNAGMVKCYIFNSSTTAPANTGEVGGITAYNAGEVINCASYGTVSGNKDTGGIVGMENTYYKGGRVERCFSSAIVECAPGQEATTGSVIGKILATTNPEYLVLKANYSDLQLSTFKPAQNDTIAGIYQLYTDALTAGAAVDSLASGYSFAKGFYPMPATVADNQAVRKAASVFFTLSQPQTLKTIAGAGIINNAFPLIAKLSKGDIFYIDGLRLVPGFSEEIVTDTLSLSIGDFRKQYPISKLVSFLKGEGTQANPWLVESIADMNKIASNSTVNVDSYEGKYFSLANDLDYQGENLQPIGHVTPFDGIFAGNGHSIKNISSRIPDGETRTYQGIFGRIGAKGAVDNLTLDNDSVEGNGYVGILAGYNAGKITNVTVDSKSHAFGTFGKAETGLNSSYIGGIAGYSGRTAAYANCVNHAAVTGNRHVGGITGWAQSPAYNDTKAAYMTDCHNDGSISSDIASSAEAGVGGIAGYWIGTMKKCTNRGNVSSGKGMVAGGIAGRLCGTSFVDSCDNHGTVTAVEAAGGLFGMNVAASARDESEITACRNFGEVSGGSFIGGITGQATTQYNYRNTSNRGNVTATVSKAGGLIGGSKGLLKQMMHIQDCWNAGTVHSAHMAAGIMGYADENGKNIITQCMNIGDIRETQVPDSTYRGTGGIANGAVVTVYSNNFGKVEGSDHVGGITGLLVFSNDTTTRLGSCYNLGIVSSMGSNTLNIGNISGTNGFTAYKCYTVNTLQPFGCDEKQRIYVVSPYELTTIKFGKLFICQEKCFPICSGMEEVDAAKAYAAYFKAAKPANDGYVYDAIELSTLEGVAWTSNQLLAIEGDIATPVATGEAELTATCGDFSKSYLINVGPAGIDNVAVDEIIAKKYYSLDGHLLDQPLKGQVNIVEILTASGKKIARRVLVK